MAIATKKHKIRRGLDVSCFPTSRCFLVLPMSYLAEVYRQTQFPTSYSLANNADRGERQQGSRGAPRARTRYRSATPGVSRFES